MCYTHGWPQHCYRACQLQYDNAMILHTVADFNVNAQKCNLLLAVRPQHKPSACFLIYDGQTDRQEAMHKSTSCNMHQWAKKGLNGTTIYHTQTFIDFHYNKKKYWVEFHVSALQPNRQLVWPRKILKLGPRHIILTEPIFRFTHIKNLGNMILHVDRKWISD